MISFYKFNSFRYNNKINLTLECNDIYRLAFSIVRFGFKRQHMVIQVDTTTSQQNNYQVFIDELDVIKLKGKVAIVTNPTVSKLHLDTVLSKLVADEVHVVSILDGEEYKNMDSVDYILGELFKLKFNRNSTLIALGGGVIGDITGFCAAIYQRGIDFIQIPTTLLAQVDASVGGKTGVNNQFGKNLIGAFHQPRAVYCETNFLQTLPRNIFNSGIAEMIKVAVVYDKEYFSWLEKCDFRDMKSLRLAISKSIQLKSKIVSLDTREKGVRAILNYGHTFAHVIERESEYKKYLHGEAVSIGMNMANNLALELGLLDMVDIERICEVLQRQNLPLSYKIEDVESFYDSFLLDKKSHDSNVTFVFPNHIGDFFLKKDVPKDTVLKVLRKFS